MDPECDSHNPALLDLFIYADAGICSAMAFPPFGNSDHVFVSVSIDWLSNLKQDAPFHYIAYDYSRADWDILRDHLRVVSWEDFLKFNASAVASKFCECFRLELMYISLIANIRSSLTHPHDFQLLMLRP